MPQTRHSAASFQGGTRRSLFRVPALHRKILSADVVDSFTFGPGTEAHEVNLELFGLRLRAVVANGRMALGLVSVDFVDEALQAQVERAAVAAVNRARCGGAA